MKKRQRHFIWLGVSSVLLGGTAFFLVAYLKTETTKPSLKTSGQFMKGSAFGSRPVRPGGDAARTYSSPVKPIVTTGIGEGLPSSSFVRTNDHVVGHINNVLAYIYQNMHPETRLSYSLPGDKRLSFWSVVYDDAMRAMVHLKTDDIENARRTMDYFIENTAVQKTGWIKKDGKVVARPGWVVNIVDAAETRPGGRSIEHVAHTGPNAYLGIAAVHLYRATQEKKYLDFAVNRWQLLRDLQNQNVSSPNYGGVRMGPMGDPENPREQRLDFKEDSPSFYSLYNGEHSMGYKALSDLLAGVDSNEERRAEYRHASQLVSLWHRKIYDKAQHLFYVGTTEERFYEFNIGEWVEPGIIPTRPLDTTALSICAYGVKGLDVFEPNAAEKIREAMDDNFRVTVQTKVNDKIRTITGYDFVSNYDRKRLILYIEEGPWGDRKIRRGVGREPMMTDEWSSWVAMADLRMSKDFLNLGEKQNAAQYWDSYRENAFGEGLKSADVIAPGVLAYPYAHPISTSFNKPVGFGWNTHHAPYSIIGGVARIMGVMGFDPFSLDATQFAYKKPDTKFEYAKRDAPRPAETLATEAEIYINQAWSYVVLAKKFGPDEQNNWRRAIAAIDRMNEDHPDWSEVAKEQNRLAGTSADQFPLSGIAPLSSSDLEPIYRKYWALYHVGTGQFIRVMAYSRLADIAKARGDKERQWDYEAKAKEAADDIVNNYYFAQAFDDGNSWMWQPVNSLAEYLPPGSLKMVEGYPFYNTAIEKAVGQPPTPRQLSQPAN